MVIGRVKSERLRGVVGGELGGDRGGRIVRKGKEERSVRSNGWREGVVREIGRGIGKGSGGEG
jgi:hypothetical protein